MSQKLTAMLGHPMSKILTAFILSAGFILWDDGSSTADIIRPGFCGFLKKVRRDPNNGQWTSTLFYWTERPKN